jgi:hypothetical protein
MPKPTYRKKPVFEICCVCSHVEQVWAADDGLICTHRPLPRWCGRNGEVEANGHCEYWEWERAPESP